MFRLSGRNFNQGGPTDLTKRLFAHYLLLRLQSLSTTYSQSDYPLVPFRDHNIGAAFQVLPPQPRAITVVRYAL
jgi:hypothetical protein